MPRSLPSLYRHKRQSGTLQQPYPWWRLAVLLLFLFFSVLLYLLLSSVAPQPDGPVLPFLPIWLICFLPYFAASIYILATRPLTGPWLWLELGIIFVGALVFHLILLPLPTGLSRDAWRYLWDAHVIVHGYNPYVYAPGDKVLEPLRSILFTNCRFRNEPTKYPPGAELFYVLSYVLAPGNMYVLKGLFTLCDLVTCGALTWLLAYRRLDPRCVIIYAWCPLPLVEFAVEGHVDALVVMFTVLAVATYQWATGNILQKHSEYGRFALTGFFLGMATLAKLYPLLLLIVFMRRWHWALLFSCVVTILLGYLPFLLLGHGGQKQVLDVLFSFSGQQRSLPGVLQFIGDRIAFTYGLNVTLIRQLEQVVTLAMVGVTALIVCIQRLRQRISIEAAALLLIGVVLVAYAHVFPWYTPALLPWIALLASSLQNEGKWFSWKDQRWERWLALATAWYFTCVVVLSNLLGQPGFATITNWYYYYEISFGIVGIGLAIAIALSCLPYIQLRKMQ
ncbi:MAG: glycosyltransferase 87 family protein [Ktedonobacteraceae bacterium]